MIITTDALRSASGRFLQKRKRPLYEAHAAGLQSVFLCHSHRDEALAKGLIALLEDAGWRVYVDWDDPTLPETPTRDTAARIKQQIKDFSFFLFLATANSMSSRWCPWEIGFADGTKPIDSILVLPTREGATTHGSEYLQLYRRIEAGEFNQLVALRPGQTVGVPVRSL